MALKRGFPEAFLRPLLFSLLVSLLALAIVAPGRWGLSLQEANQGGAAWAVFCVGVCLDLEQQILALTACFVVGSAIAALVALVRRKPFAEAQRKAGLVIVALCVPVFLLFHVSASEFFYQRGGYPTLYDVKLGWEHHDAASASLPALFFGRYLGFELLFAAVWLMSLFLLARRKVSLPSSFREALVAAGALTLMAVLGFQIHRKAENIFPSISDSGVVTSPWASLRHDLGERDPIEGYYGLRTLLTREAARLVADGRDGRPLGFPEGRGSSCAEHPLARPLPGEGEDGELTGAAVRVSRELFAHMSEAPIVWHIVAESLRGDDIKGINPEAPAEAAPFLSSLYEASASPVSGVIAAPRIYESGPRTVQGLSAAFCGAGSLPFQWALVRDFGRLPLRCLPDVLVDSGFVGEAIKGFSFEFEKQGPFFRNHGFSTVETSGFPPGGPRGSWGLSDRYVLGETLRRVSRKLDPRPQYRVVITLSNHGPNVHPEDAFPGLERSLEALLAGRAHDGADLARMLTFTYTDGALAEFVSAVRGSPLGPRSIFIMHADHSTRETFLWHQGQGPSPFRHHLPFVMLVPPELPSAWPRLRDSLGELNAALARQPLSLDDVPSLILALLSQSEPLKSLSSQWRWHTLGGQATSPHFTFGSDAALWGVGASGHLFTVHSDGSVRDGESVPRLQGGESGLRNVNGALRPVLGFLAGFLDEYVSPCHAPVRQAEDPASEK